MLERLTDIVGKENVFEKESMVSHSTFRAGGCADYFVEVKTKEELSALVKMLESEDYQYMVIGNGSNILVRDSGFKGVIIHLTGEVFDFIELSKGNEEKLLVKAGAAAFLSVMCKKAGKMGYTGLEGLAGIPGSVGGAVVMNAGAYGDEVKDTLVESTCMDKNGNILKLTKDDLELSYRHSAIMEKKLVVLDATFELEKGNLADIEEKMKEYARLRKEKQPLEYPSAGSTFKRPTGHFAGKLIMDAGLRGYKVGGAMVSEKHCGFVINAGEATATDILTLMDDVQSKVKKEFGVTLEPEVRIIG